MARTAKKLNFLIEDHIFQELQVLVPAGQRSKVVNEALGRELELIRRKKAVEKLLTSHLPTVSLTTRQIVQELAKDRSSHI